MTFQFGRWEVQDGTPGKLSDFFSLLNLQCICLTGPYTVLTIIIFRDRAYKDYVPSLDFLSPMEYLLNQDLCPMKCQLRFRRYPGLIPSNSAGCSKSLWKTVCKVKMPKTLPFPKLCLSVCLSFECPLLRAGTILSCISRKSFRILLVLLQTNYQYKY